MLNAFSEDFAYFVKNEKAFHNLCKQRRFSICAKGKGFPLLYFLQTEKAFHTLRREGFYPL